MMSRILNHNRDQNTCVSCNQRVEYVPLKTGSNDPTITKRMQYARGLRSGGNNAPTKK